jgi:hypothetical protein
MKCTPKVRQINTHYIYIELGIAPGSIHLRRVMIFTRYPRARPGVGAGR